jgi:hypothetical protein
VICHSIGPETKNAYWDERLRPGCPVDVDQTKKKKCADRSNADLRVEFQGQQLILVASNGALLSKTNPDVETCQAAAYTETVLRADNLGSGFDVCVKSDRGKFYKIYFIDQVPGEPAVIPVRFVPML